MISNFVISKLVKKITTFVRRYKITTVVKKNYLRTTFVSVQNYYEGTKVQNC